jgi:hypothetical protein
MKQKSLYNDRWFLFYFLKDFPELKKYIYMYIIHLFIFPVS